MAKATALLLAAIALRAQAGPTNTFEIVGNSGVAAQQIFLAHSDKVIIVDKTEPNGNGLTQAGGGPAYSAQWSVSGKTATPLSTVSNAFCAAGAVLANGTWLNTGGNSQVGPGGLPPDRIGAGVALYPSQAGGKSVRRMDPCPGDQECTWTEMTNYFATARWYPAMETLMDGSAIVYGGCLYGGYVNEDSQAVNTYEFIPSRGPAIASNFLASSMPANLYTLMWLLPSGNIFTQATYKTGILDYRNNREYQLPDIPDAVKTYPSSGATAMLPMTPANNYSATMIFCGGNDLKPDQFVTTFNIAAYPTVATCVKMTPDVSTTWENDDPLPEGRTMGNLIAMPDGRYFLLNGAALGTAAYGNTTWAIGQSFADKPIYRPAIFDPEAPAGSRWSREGLGTSTVPRLYHSVATLLPDGSIMTTGSNPASDYIPQNFVENGQRYTYFTEYRVEYYYPDYFNKPRPAPTGLPEQISYGGAYFNVSLAASDLPNKDTDLSATKVVIIRHGFSTHGMNMGQRYVQLNHTASYDSAAGTATLHVSQAPPNAGVIAPGPAFIYVVVNGVPSIGQEIMIGSGQIGTQPISAVAPLPAFSGLSADAAAAAASGSSNRNSNSANTSNTSSNSKSAAVSVHQTAGALGLLATLCAVMLL